jgi:hypothetical protein
MSIKTHAGFGIPDGQIVHVLDLITIRHEPVESNLSVKIRGSF